MEKIQILSLHIQCLKYLLLWPKENLTKTQNAILNYGYFCLSTSFSIPVMCAAGYQFYVGVEDVNILVEALIAVCDIIGYLVVYYCFLRDYELVQNLLDGINIFLEFCDRKFILDIDARCISYTRYLLWYVTIGVTINIIWPLISVKGCINSRMSEFYIKHDPCGMPTQNFYFFDASKPQYFWIVYLIEANYCYHICYAFSLATAITTGFLMHILAQLRNCGKMFEEVFNDDCNSNEKEFEKKFFKCVKYHQTILNYAERFFYDFSNMLIIYVTMTSFTLAVISYQIANSETKLHDRLRYTMLLFGWILLFFLICHYGQRVKDESLQIGESIYNSKWHKSTTNLRFRKYIILVIARSHKPLSLRAKYMGTISLTRYVAVLKTAYSFFTLLISVTDDD